MVQIIHARLSSSANLLALIVFVSGELGAHLFKTWKDEEEKKRNCEKFADFCMWRAALELFGRAVTFCQYNAFPLHFLSIFL